jgi:hypothetical protein
MVNETKINIPPDFIEFFDANKFKFDRWLLRFEGALEI